MRLGRPEWYAQRTLFNVFFEALFARMDGKKMCRQTVVVQDSRMAVVDKESDKHVPFQEIAQAMTDSFEKVAPDQCRFYT